MTKDDLVKAGYRAFPVGILESNWAESAFQKDFRDERGKVRYYLNVYFSKDLKLPDIRVQIEIPQGYLNLELFSLSSGDVKGIETLFAKIWRVLKARYYE